MIKILDFSSFSPVFNSHIILVFSLSEIPWNCHKHLTKNKHTKLKKTNLLETPKIWKKKKTNSPVFFNRCWIDFNIFWLQELKKPSFFFSGLWLFKRLVFSILDISRHSEVPHFASKTRPAEAWFFSEKKPSLGDSLRESWLGSKEESLTSIPRVC